MPLLRATFFFEDSNKHGWSETLHSLKPDLTAALSAANSLKNVRRNLLGSSARMTMVRVSDDLIKRDSRIILIPAADGVTRTNGDKAADIANTSLVVRIEAINPVTRRTLYMRGFPDGIVTLSGLYTPDGQFLADFAAWALEIEANDWAVKSRDTTTPRTLIAGVTQDVATGLVTITTIAPHGIAAGEPVTVRGIVGPAIINGNFVPFSIPSATSLTHKTFALIAAYGGGGYVQRLGYTLAAARDPRVIRVSHRMAGRPFDSPVGRRKAR